MNYFKIWLKIIRKTLNLRAVTIFFAVHLVILLTIYFLSNNNIVLAFVLLIFLMIMMSITRLFLFYKKLVDSDSFDQILLKPIDPLFGLIAYKMNIADIVILLPIIIFLKFKNK